VAGWRGRNDHGDAGMARHEGGDRGRDPAGDRGRHREGDAVAPAEEISDARFRLVDRGERGPRRRRDRRARFRQLEPARVAREEGDAQPLLQRPMCC
jgi:hypothetical protein